VGVGARLASLAAGRAHVLAVEVPGWWALRVLLERETVRRGWVLADSPADADVLAVCGVPGQELASVIAAVWDQLPGPRVRVEVATPEEVAAALDTAATRLADAGRHRRDARQRAAAPAAEDHHGDRETEHMEMDMAPSGIPLAVGGEDRDGLEMDVLHLPLGPVLPHWPAGLVLRCALQGDVLTEAEAQVLHAAHQPPDTPDTPAVHAARRCDAVVRLLAVAGWDDAAAAARRARDLLLCRDETEQAHRLLRRLRRRVGRSWTLRWLLRGMGTVDEAFLEEHHLPRHLVGDVHDRLVALLAVTEADPVGAAAQRTVLAALPTLVGGLDLAAARLVVASVDPDVVVLEGEGSHV
jgi:hypothetical protein